MQVKEVNLNGSIYQIDFSNENVLKLEAKLQTFYKTHVELRDKAHKKPSYATEATIELIGYIEQIIDDILGKGSYKVLREENSGSSVEMVKLIAFLGGIIEKRAKLIKKKRKKK